jgi:hypothetical protein
LRPSPISATEGASTGNFGKEAACSPLLFLGLRGNDRKHWMREPLVFEGIRWPGAKIVAREQVIAARPVDDKKVPLFGAFIIETTGKGRPYSVGYAEGWWRDFADLPLDDERRVLSFLGRRGDPFGKLAPDGTQIATLHWRGLQAVLGQAAAAWTQPDEAGVSHFRPEMFKLAEWVLSIPEWTGQIGVVYRGLVPVLSTKLLAAYMCAAAAASLRAGLGMRRCLYCSSWFELHRREAMFCTPSCRAAHFNRRISPHGLDLARDHPQRDDSLASSLARTKHRRKTAQGKAQFRDPERGQGVRRAHGAGARVTRRRRPAPA